MKYCSACGNEVHLAVPEGDNRTRHVCAHCNTIHYSNPKIVTGCIVHWQNKVLLCRRAIEPRYGLWTVPAGFMENGETTYQGAIRETLEEANARVSSQKLYVLVNLPHIDQVYMLFLAELADLDFSPGEESLDVELFTEEEIPWNEMAFPTVSKSLELYFEDYRQGEFGMHILDITLEDAEKRQFRIEKIQ